MDVYSIDLPNDTEVLLSLWCTASTQDKDGILPVATLSIALYASCRSRSDSNAAPEVAKLSSAL